MQKANPNNTGDSAAQWRRRVESELKGKPFNDLVHHIGEQEILPMYFEHATIAPHNSHQPWLIHEEFAGNDAEELNKQVLLALEGGAQSIGIPFIAGQMNILLENVLIEYIHLHLRGVSYDLSCINEMSALLTERTLATSAWKGSIDIDAAQCTFEFINELHSPWKNTFSGVRIFQVDSVSVHDTGVDEIAELVCMLRRSNAALDAITAAGINADDASAMMHWRTGIGTDFFNETAKFRAWRILWDALIKAFHPQHQCSSHTVVHAHISSAEYSPRDTHNNLLRISTAVLSAALGGAQYISADAYTQLTEAVSPADRRITRNVQHLLIEEGSIHQYLDATDGAHYFEAITEAIANAAWSKFMSFADLDENAFISYLHESAAQRKTDILTGKRVVVGSNKFVDGSAAIFASPTATHISAVAEKP